MNAPFDVLVIGAGPVGLTMACELARNGVKCRIIDKTAAPASTSRALAIFPRTLEMFQMMGMSGPVLEAGHPLDGVAIYGRSGQIGHIGFSSLPSRYRFAISLPQSETERLLMDHLAGFGIAVERERELVDLSQSATAAQAVIRNSDGLEERLESGWLIACDGAHSSVRHLLNLPFEGAAYPETFLLADVKIEGHLDHIHIHLFLTGEGVVGIFPFRGDRCRIIVNTQTEAEDQPLGELRLDEIQAVVKSRTNSEMRLVDPVWLSRFRISHRKISDFRVGRVFLAGDAAHIHSPAGGQGMNTGIQDAVNLAWKLALVVHKKSSDSLLNSYNEEREPVAKMVLSLTDRLTRMATLQGALGQQLRNALLPLLTGIHLVEDRIAETMSEIGIHYRRSSIVSGKTGHAVQAGDRAPDCEFQLETVQEPLRLLDLLQKPAHHLLFFADADADLAARSNALRVEIGHNFPGFINAFVVIRGAHANFSSVLFDVDGAAHSLYEAEPGAIVLIRPDGYIGFRGGAKHAGALREHLERIFQGRIYTESNPG
ncbi:MAG: FAD-dependent monooxygenase [Verrucomicrobia bacterium]|nr:FAD-dependent monooxygenase [Verrucomicrobiota bacterium]